MKLLTNEISPETQEKFSLKTDQLAKRQPLALTANNEENETKIIQPLPWKEKNN